MENKKVLKFFTIFECEKEQDYLRKMHNEGWKLVKVSGLCVYHFVKCQPEDVVYQLDYNKEGTKHKEEYVQMFRDCGWEYLQDYVGYSYFRKPVSQMNGEEEIFCDESSKLEMMDRVFKGRMIPLLVLFFLVVVPFFIIGIIQQEYIICCIYGIAIGFYLVLFIMFAFKRNKFKSNMKN